MQMIIHLLAALSLSACPVSPSFATLFSFSVSSLVFVYEILRSPNALINSALLADPPAFIMASSILHKYCCYGPKIEPGLAIRIHPVKSAGGNPICFMMYSPISVPVLPRPALQ